MRLFLLLLLLMKLRHNHTGSVCDDESTVAPQTTLPLNESVCYQEICKTETFRYCRCDKNCFKYEDCCLGVYNEEEETENRETDIYEGYEHPDFFHGFFIKVVGKCPPEWEEETERQRCQDSQENSSDVTLMFPMTSSKTNIVYKNVACAKCNEGNQTDFQLQFYCPEMQEVPNSIEEGFQLYLHNRSCLPKLPENADIFGQRFEVSNNTIISCPSSWPTNDLTSWRCRIYLAPLTFKGNRYKNVFCAECNGFSVKPEEAECRDTLFPTNDTFVFLIDANYSKGGELPFSETKNQARCEAGSVYDPFQQQCRKLLSLSSEKSPVCDTSSSKVTPQSDISFDEIKIPDCKILTYQETDYELRDSKTYKGEKEALIKTSGEIFQEPEYIVLQNGILEVCEKLESPLPVCVASYCPDSNSSRWRPCSCESDCYVKGDCCLDALTEQQSSIRTDNDPLNCVSIFSGTRVYAINRCPQNYTSEETRNYCESSTSDDPFNNLAAFSLDSKTTYKNIYCAMCHNDTDLRFLPIKITCYDLLNVPDVITALKWSLASNSTCYISHMIPYFFPITRCQLLIKSECPKNWRESTDARRTQINWRCNKILAPISIDNEKGKQYYKNIYCAVCNEVDLPSKQNEYRCENHRVTV